MSASPFRVKCDRCGEPYYPDKAGEIFKVQYETMGYIDKVASGQEPEHAWRTLNLCFACQNDLRTEFYRRGLTHYDS